MPCRFYQCFESIQQYGVSVVQLVEELESGETGSEASQSSWE